MDIYVQIQILSTMSSIWLKHWPSLGHSEGSKSIWKSLKKKRSILLPHTTKPTSASSLTHTRLRARMQRYTGRHTAGNEQSPLTISCSSVSNSPGPEFSHSPSTLAAGKTQSSHHLPLLPQHLLPSLVDKTDSSKLHLKSKRSDHQTAMKIKSKTPPQDD